jgi:uncharacterized membrane protein
VGVGLRGDAQVGVPEGLLDGLGFDTVAEQGGGAEVAQAVKGAASLRAALIRLPLKRVEVALRQVGLLGAQCPVPQAGDPPA